MEEEWVPSRSFGCGQIYHYWWKHSSYWTTLEDYAIEVSVDQKRPQIKTDAPKSSVRKFLGLDDPLREIYDKITIDSLMEEVVNECHGLRIMRDDFFASLVSFILSTQSTIERTKKMVRRLCETHGEPRAEAYTFPSPGKVAALDEDELRGLGFGYRAPYIKETARKVGEWGLSPEELRRLEYSEAHKDLKRFPGVGDKVADCVLLFSLGHLDVVALDTRINQIIDKYYPELRDGDYRETSENFRNHFGEYTGYAQTYLYHWWG